MYTRGCRAVGRRMEDFESASTRHQRGGEAEAGLAQYIAGHPEVTSLLHDLVTSCLVSKPADVFAHASAHFVGSTVPMLAADVVTRQVASQFFDGLVTSAANRTAFEAEA